MALNNIGKIKDAELAASKKITEAEENSRENLRIAEEKASEIIAKAYKDSEIYLEHETDKAKSKAEGIIISAQNSAKLKMEALKSKALKKQDEVNKEIIKIII